MGLIVLQASDDYCFVETGADGEVEHYHPSLVCAERHHMVTVICSDRVTHFSIAFNTNVLILKKKVKGGATTEVFMPISPQIEQGSISVNIRVLSHIFEQNLEIGIDILVNFIWNLLSLCLHSRS